MAHNDAPTSTLEAEPVTSPASGSPESPGIDATSATAARKLPPPPPRPRSSRRRSSLRRPMLRRPSLRRARARHAVGRRAAEDQGRRRPRLPDRHLGQHGAGDRRAAHQHQDLIDSLSSPTPPGSPVRDWRGKVSATATSAATAALARGQPIRPRRGRAQGAAGATAGRGGGDEPSRCSMRSTPSPPWRRRRRARRRGPRQVALSQRRRARRRHLHRRLVQETMTIEQAKGGGLQAGQRHHGNRISSASTLPVRGVRPPQSDRQVGVGSGRIRGLSPQEALRKFTSDQATSAHDAAARRHVSKSAETVSL